MKQIFLLSVLALLLTTCLQSQSNYEEINNIAYLSPENTVAEDLQQLNLVLPKDVENPPLLLWIGGGAWSFVNRHQEMNLARKFAESGVAVAAVGHQLSKGAFSPNAKKEGVQHPSHVIDVAASFKWLKDNAEKYGYDAGSIFVGGFSSGAHLAALLAMDEQYLAKHDLKTDDIKAIIPVAGAYDINHYYNVFLNHEDDNIRPWAQTHVEDVFGDPAGFESASPATYLKNLKIPMLLISEGDLFEYTQVFEEMIWESEYRDCQILHVLDKGHASLWRDISNADESQTRNAMVDFIKRHQG